MYRGSLALGVAVSLLLCACDRGADAANVVPGSAGTGAASAPPAKLGQGGLRHPIFVWGCGGGSGDPRLRTTIHVAGGSLNDVDDPRAPTSGLGGMRLVDPAAFICAESDVFGNVEKTEADYAAAPVPVFFTVITGADHVGAAREGLPAIVAWLRWHIGGADDRSSMFLDPAGEFRGGKYVSQTKELVT